MAESKKGVCPHCGGTSFRVYGMISIDFDLVDAGSVEVGSRKFEDPYILKDRYCYACDSTIGLIYCNACNRIAGHRDRWEADGLAVPI